MDYIFELFLYITATLVGNLLWQVWLDKQEMKKQKAKTVKTCLEKIQSCIHEFEYNESHAIGGPRCPFQTEEQKQLLYSEEISLIGEELKTSLKDLITEIGVINGHGVFTYGNVKSKSNLLKIALQSRAEELKKPPFFSSN